MRMGDRDPLWAWFWMNQGMTIQFSQNKESFLWSIKIFWNVLNPLKSISWIPPWGPDFTSLQVCREINPAVPAVVKETPYKPLQMARRVGALKPSDPNLLRSNSTYSTTSARWAFIFRRESGSTRAPFILIPQWR